MRQIKKIFSIFVSLICAVSVSLQPTSLSAADYVSLHSKMHSSLVEQLSRVPKQASSHRSLAQSLRTQEAIISWVKQTRLLPYRGSLKGAEGVFFEREGNSLDRAILLSEMLRSKDVETRIALFRIDRELASTLLQNALSSKRNAGEIKLPIVTDPVSPADLGLSNNAWDDFSDHVSVVAELATEIRFAMFEALQTDLSSFAKGVRQDIPLHSLRRTTEAALEALSEYWVVQAKRGGSWESIEIDGIRLRERNLTPTAVFAPDRIPAEWFHTVSFELVAHIEEQGSTFEESLLNLTTRASDFDGDTLTVSILPLKSIPIRNIDLQDDLPGDIVDRRGVEMLTYLTSAESPNYEGVSYWVPIFSTFGGEKLIGDAVRIDGRRLNRAQLNIDIADTSSKTNSVLTRLNAISLRIATAFDGKETSNRKRHVVKYDASGRVQRVSLTGSYAVQTRRYSKDEAALRSLRRAVRVAQLLSAEEPIGKFSPSNLSRFCNLCEEYALLRWSVSDANDLAFIHLPNIVGLKHYHIIEDTVTTRQMTFDIVENRIETVPSASVDPFKLRFEQSIRDAVAETTLLALDTTAVKGTTTAFLHRQSDWTEVRLSELQDRPSSESQRSLLNLKSEGKQILSQTFASDQNHGYWWALDPITGNMIGYNNTQDGAAAVGITGIIIAGAIVASIITFGGCVLRTTTDNHVDGKTLSGHQVYTCVMFAAATLAAPIVTAALAVNASALAAGITAGVIVGVATILAYLAGQVIFGRLPRRSSGHHLDNCPIKYADIFGLSCGDNIANGALESWIGVHSEEAEPQETSAPTVTPSFSSYTAPQISMGACQNWSVSPVVSSYNQYCAGAVRRPSCRPNEYLVDIGMGDGHIIAEFGRERAKWLTSHACSSHLNGALLELNWHASVMKKTESRIGHNSACLSVLREVHDNALQKIVTDLAIHCGHK